MPEQLTSAFPSIPHTEGLDVMSGRLQQAVAQIEPAALARKCSSFGEDVLELYERTLRAESEGTAALLLGRAELEDYHREEGLKALADAVQALATVGIVPHLHVAVGAPAAVVLAFAHRLGVQLIVMGTRGFGGGVAGAVMGSVASDVVTGASVPVTLLNSD